MPEPDHIIVVGPDLTAEMNAILARFGVEAVIRVVRRMVEEGQTSSPFHEEREGNAGQS
jgi:hypothetical protein